MIEHVKKHDEHHDGAHLTLSDWSHQLVMSAASGVKLKQSIAISKHVESHFDDITVRMSADTNFLTHTFFSKE